MNKILIIIIILITSFTLSYADPQPINDVCVYPIYTSQTFCVQLTYDWTTETTYTVRAIHYINSKILDLITTTNQTADVSINESGIWEIQIIVDGNTTLYGTTLNQNNCIVDNQPQKWVVYTSPAPPGAPLIE